MLSPLPVCPPHIAPFTPSPIYSLLRSRQPMGINLPWHIKSLQDSVHPPPHKAGQLVMGSTGRQQKQKQCTPECGDPHGD